MKNILKRITKHLKNYKVEKDRIRKRKQNEDILKKKKSWVTEFKNKFKLNYNKFKVKLRLKWQLIRFNENRFKIKKNIVKYFFRLIYIGLSGLAYLLVLRLINYEMTLLNWFSCIALYFIIQEIPEFVKRSRK